MPEEMGDIVTWQLGIRTTIIQAEKRELDEGLTSGNPKSPVEPWSHKSRDHDRRIYRNAGHFY